MQPMRQRTGGTPRHSQHARARTLLRPSLGCGGAGPPLLSSLLSTISRRVLLILFAYAELAKDAVQHLLSINGSRHPAQRPGSRAQLLAGNLQLPLGCLIGLQGGHCLAKVVPAAVGRGGRSGQ